MVLKLEEFWSSFWYTSTCRLPGRTRGYRIHEIPGPKWFEGAELNYAEHVFRNARDRYDEPAVMQQSELRPLSEMTWRELQEKVGALAAGLKDLGVGRGDRVVAYVPNVPEAIVAFLACASLGAVWSSCSPDFGVGSVVDRFAQIEPKVLFAVDGYRYGGQGPRPRRSLGAASGGDPHSREDRRPAVPQRGAGDGCPGERGPLATELLSAHDGGRTRIRAGAV